MKGSFILLPVLCLFSGCSLFQRANSDTVKSSIEIDYVRGHNHHRLVATAKEDAARVEMFRDRTLTQQANINREQYLKLLRQAEAVLVQRTPAATRALPNCRTPFVIKVVSDIDTRKAEGCRNGDEGAAVGKLIHEAEFLVSRD